MLSINVAISFNVAKRLKGFSGKCANLHGYSMTLHAEFSSPQKSDYVDDFYSVRKVIADWIEANWEHNLLLSKDDKDLGDAVSEITSQKIFYFDKTPTAENIALYIKDILLVELLPHLHCESVKLFDTDEHWVELR